MENLKGKNMKLSIESIGAAAVAAAFMAFTAGAMAQGHSMGQIGGPNNFGPTNNPGVNTHMSQQGDKSSLFGRTNAEENIQKFSVESGRQQREERRDAREQRQDRLALRQQREGRQDAREQRQDRQTLPSTGTHINPNGNASSTLFSPFSFLNRFGSGSRANDQLPTRTASRTGAREQRADRHDARQQREGRQDVREQRQDRLDARQQRQDRRQALRQQREGRQDARQRARKLIGTLKRLVFHRSR